MYKKISQLFLSLSFLITGFLFVSVDEAHAECIVLSADFRTNNFNPNWWYTQTNPPYVYIDFTTSGCVGDSFDLSITEQDDDNSLDNINDDDLAGVADNLEIIPTANNFTLAFLAGEDQCEEGDTPDCNYYIRINDDVLGGVNDIQLTSNLRYNCDGPACLDSWEYVAMLQVFGANHPNDTSGNNTGGNGGGGGSGATGGGGTLSGVTSVNIDIQNPIGDNDMTLYDFIKKVIDFALKIGIPIVAIAIIYSGLLFVTARGNDSQLETAKNAFTYAVIGGAVLLGSWIFARLIKETIESIAMIMNYFA